MRCPLCNQPLQWVTSTLAKVVLGYGSRYIEDKDQSRLSLNEEGELVETVVMKRIGYPNTAKLRICHRTECQRKILEIIPEWDKGQLRLPERDLSKQRSTKEKGELTIDPRWMTSRGRPDRTKR